jgi:hypothetical protein
MNDGFLDYALLHKHDSTMHRIVRRVTYTIGRDLYTTQPESTDRFLRALQRDKVILPEPIFECAAGQGDMVHVLKRYYKDVIYSDLVPYSDDTITIHSLDVYKLNPTESEIEFGTFFTNPPFNEQNKFALKLLSFNKTVALFVRITFLSSIKRLVIFKNFPPKYVYVFSRRANCLRGGAVLRNGGMVDYCFIIWEPSYKGEPILRWVDNYEL